MKKRYHILVMVMMYICFNISPKLIATTYAAKEKIVHLRNSSHTLLLQNYLIDEVVDMREDKTRIGYMRTAVTEEYFNVKYPQLLAKELQTYIHNNTKGNGQAFKLYVYEYFLSERATPKGCDVALTVHYALYNNKEERLLDFYDVGSNLAAINMTGKIETLLSDMMKASLLKIDERIKDVQEEYISNNNININCVLVRIPDAKQYISYNSLKKLSLKHFKAKPALKNSIPFYADCNIISSYQVLCEDHSINVVLQLLPYFNMNTSWIRSDMLDEQLLEYVNTYYKITASVSKEFIDEINETSFTLQTLHTKIKDIESKHLRRLQILQQQFLEDTNYIADTDQYYEWQNNIAVFPDIFSFEDIRPQGYRIRYR